MPTIPLPSFMGAPAAAGAHEAGVVGATPMGSRPPISAHHALTPVQRRCMVAAVLALHGAAGWGLLQVREVRNAVALAAPMFVDLIAPPAPPVPAPPLAPPPQQPPRAVSKALPPPPAPLIAAAPAPLAEPTAFVVPPPPELPPPAELPQPTAVVLAAPPAPPAPPPPTPAPPVPTVPTAPPKLIPASAVQYLEPPAPEFPRASRRLGESGRVLLRVYIDEAGLPRQVLLAQSSGFARLDDAAIAAMKKARFRPYTENGQASAGWAPAPIDFELER